MWSKITFLTALFLLLISVCAMAIGNIGAAHAWFSDNNTVELLGYVMAWSAVVGFLLLPIGVALLKRTWRYSEQYLFLAAIGVCISILWTITPIAPDADSLVGKNIWELFIHYFVDNWLLSQALLQTGVLAGIRCWVTSRAELAPRPQGWLWAAPLLAWLLALYPLISIFFLSDWCC